jgi:hypothetical protein
MPSSKGAAASDGTASGVTQLTPRATQDLIGQIIGGSVTASGIRHALSTLPADVINNPGRGHYEIADQALLAWLRDLK